EAAAAAGGGTVWLPAGTYMCFTIRLKSNVHLYLDQGSTVLAADSPKPGESGGYRGGRYDLAEPQNPAIEPFQDYGHNHWHNSLIWGEELHDISITGPGLIWGRGLSNGRNRKTLGNPFTAEYTGTGNKAIALKNCHNVHLADFNILKGGHFGLLLTGVDNLTIDGLVIDTDRDGMDIDCCKNVRVAKCTVNAPWDDAICPKSSFALGYARATENLTISNCYVSGCWILGTLLDGTFKRITDPDYAFHTGRIKCGTESNGGFKNVTITNCTFEGCQGLALETVDGALLEDVTISNLAMRDIVSCPIFLRLGARLRGPKDTTKVGTLRRVLINNIVAHNSASDISSIISGIPGYAIEDVKVANVFVDHKGGKDASAAMIQPPEDVSKYPEPGMFGPMPCHGFFLRHLRGLEMSHVEIRPDAPDARPAFYLQDVTRADFLAVTAPANKAFALHDVKDFRLLWSRAAPDTNLNQVSDSRI
ncbi:MAG TPA: right-handed parallel beta-helix repeat-containing protein, partial [Candidatus Saccharimonadales bacterium]|nr:right-handed parallel beta-helix repeat-containing protein [Candidatus Saccharimonadales bacterium]